MDAANDDTHPERERLARSYCKAMGYDPEKLNSFGRPEWMGYLGLVDRLQDHMDRFAAELGLG